MYFVSVCFRGGLGFMNCDDIYMFVVNKQFELINFVLVPFMVTCNIFRFLLILLLCLCACVVCVVMWSSLEVVLVQCVAGVVTDACDVVCVERVWECEGKGNGGVGDGGGVFMVSVGHEYMSGTRGSGIVYSADYVLDMSVVRG